MLFGHSCNIYHSYSCERFESLLSMSVVCDHVIPCAARQCSKVIGRPTMNVGDQCIRPLASSRWHEEVRYATEEHWSPKLQVPQTFMHDASLQSVNINFISKSGFCNSHTATHMVTAFHTAFHSCSGSQLPSPARVY